MAKTHFWEKILGEKKKKPEYFLALEIEEEKIKAAVWQNLEGTVTLLGVGEKAGGANWEEKVRLADEAIIEASGEIPQEEIKKVIFGLSPAWIEGQKIKSLHLAHLKKLCDDLALEPLGFTSIPEALVAYLKNLEGVPPSVILVKIGTEQITLTLVKVGKILGSQTQPRSQDLGQLVANLLGEFSEVEVFPSRILLYDAESDLEKGKQELLSFPWTQKLSFLHLPKIEILSSDFDIKALAFSCARQMGTTFSWEETVAEKEVPEEGETENFGFLKDKDILEEEQTSSPEIPVIPSPLATNLRHFRFPKIKIPAIPSFNFSFPTFPPKWLAIGLILLFLVLGGGAVLFIFLPRVQISLEVEPQVLEKEASLTINPNLTTPSDKDQVAGKIITVEERGTKKALTTGKKDVGDPTKGELTIFNKTLAGKTFPSGSQISGADLKFTLDEEVTVASATDTGISLEYGQAKVGITALAAGPAGNLAAGVNFSFKDFPQSFYFAKNEKDLSGGTSREVSVVTKNDQERVVSTLSAELAQKAQGDLLANLGSGERLVEKSQKATTKQKKFDKDVNEEGQELSLTLAMSFQALSFSEKIIKERLFQDLENSVPLGFELQSQRTEIEIAEVTLKKDDSADAKVKVKATLLPKIEEEKIKKEIAGKRLSFVRAYLEKLENVKKVEIRFSPTFWRFGLLPFSPKNLQIERVWR